MKLSLKNHQRANNLIAVLLMLIGWKTIQMSFGFTDFMVWGMSIDPMDNNVLYALIVFTLLSSAIITLFSILFGKLFMWNIKYSKRIARKRRRFNWG